MTDVFSAFAGRPRPAEDGLLRGPVGAEGDRVRALLAAVEPRELSAEQVRDELAGNLSMLSPEAFRYFLPGLMARVLDAYDRLGLFAAELVTALTEPSREDVERSLDRIAEIPPALGLSPEMLGQLREQQLEWYDSGVPSAAYRERVGELTPAERDAVLSFLHAVRDAHGDDFPFGELEAAIDSHRAGG